MPADSAPGSQSPFSEQNRSGERAHFSQDQQMPGAKRSQDDRQQRALQEPAPAQNDIAGVDARDATFDSNRIAAQPAGQQTAGTESVKTEVAVETGHGDKTLQITEQDASHDMTSEEMGSHSQTAHPADSEQSLLVDVESTAVPASEKKHTNDTLHEPGDVQLVNEFNQQRKRNPELEVEAIPLTSRRTDTPAPGGRVKVEVVTEPGKQTTRIINQEKSDPVVPSAEQRIQQFLPEQGRDRRSAQRDARGSQEIPQVRIGQINVLVDEQDPARRKPSRAKALKTVASPFGIRGL